MSASLVPDSQHNRIKPPTSTDVIKLIFSYSSPRDLLCCTAINKQWKKAVENFLNQLEDPRGVRHPILTRAVFIQKLKDCVAIIEPNQEFRLNATLFRGKGNQTCPIIKTTFIFNPSRFSFLQKRPKTLEVVLDELSDTTTAFSVSAGTRMGANRDGQKYTSHFRSRADAATVDLVTEIESIVQERIGQLEASFVQSKSRKCIAATATVILVALAALYIFSPPTRYL